MIAKIRKSFVILYTSLLFCAGAVGAENFPPKTDAIVQDHEQVMEPSQVKQLSDIVEKLPEKYKILIIPSTEELSTQEYSNQLFTQYGLSPDQILLVFNLDKQELGVKAGSALGAKGLTDAAIKQTVDHFFVPSAKQKSYMTGISVTAEKLSNIAQTGLPATPNPAVTNPEGAEKSNSWVYYVVLLLIAMFGSGVYVHLQRKKWTQEMDDIEEWMDKIEEKLKRLDEDPQVKLNEKGNVITGLIERVRNESLPKAEYGLLEAESMSDRFRFKKVGFLVQQTKDLLASTDHEISQVQSRLFQNKITAEECERITEEIRQACSILGKKLDEASIQFGITFKEFRELLAQVNEGLDTTPEEDLSTFLDELKSKKQALLEALKELEEYPNLKEEVAVTLDQDLFHLQGDLKEMIDRGYQIPVEIYESFTLEIKEELSILQGLLSEGLVEGITHRVNELKDQMDSFYDMMEEIVTKKAMIEHYLREIPVMLKSLEIEEKQLTDELEELSVRYSVQEGAIFNYYLQLQRVCQEVADQLFLVKQMDSGNDIEYIQAANKLGALQAQIEQLLLLREEAYEELEELRKGEFEAKDKVTQLHAELVHLEQQIRRRNLPGIPHHLTDKIESGKQALYEIELVLNQVPLELQKINTLVKEAEEYTGQIVQDTESVFNLSELVEEKIQLTNRYRRQSKEIDNLLTEAEEAFRNAEYEEAHQLATEAYELAMKHAGGRSLKGSSFFRR